MSRVSSSVRQGPAPGLLPSVVLGGALCVAIGIIIGLLEDRRFSPLRQHPVAVVSRPVPAASAARPAQARLPATPSRPVTPAPPPAPADEPAPAPSDAGGPAAASAQDPLAEATRLLVRRRYTAAQALLLKMHEQQKDRVDVLEKLGAAAEGLGRFDAAEESYWQALKLRPDYAPAVFGLAFVLDRRGRHSEAVEWYGKYLQMAPRGRYAKMARQRLDRLRGAAQAAAPADAARGTETGTETESAP